ncbi:MAG TPA: ABC transporter permease [Bryobacteraceae bacterium]|jgi:putative ABC transport system permease protein|nr:ABC transporter permease [Bryobacteraceae bacterium]
MRYAIRTLLRSPGFAAAAVMTLGLGIGANTAIFSAVDAALLRPLPLSHPERLVQLWETHPSFPHLAVAFPDYIDWRTQTTSFEQVAAWGYESFQITGVGEPEKVDGSIVSDNFLATTGLRPALGRGFVDGETQAVMLGDALWRRKFNGDPGIVGRSIRMNGASFVVVGVLPGPQLLPKDVDLLTPFGTMIPDFDRTSRLHHVVRVVGKLKTGVTLPEAAAEIRGISTRLEHDYPATNKSIGTSLLPMAREIEGDSRTPLLVLLAVVGLVLLIATANVANLLLARAAGRRKEIAIRIALGAGRGQLVRQLLTESMVLAGAGGVCGILLAVVATPWLRVLAEGRIARASEIAVDGQVLLFAFAVALAAGILFGLVPALAATRTDQNTDLRSGGRGSGGNLHRSLRAALVSGQVALAMLVLVGAALLTRSLMRLTGVDPGFRIDHLLTARVALPGSYQSNAQIAGFFDQLMAQMAAKPGVTGVAETDWAPLTDAIGATRFAVDGEPPPELGRYPVAHMRRGSPNYFELMHIPILAGRGFTAHDYRFDDGAPILVNETLARQYYHGHAVGRNLLLGVLGPKPVAYPIVGVVADTLELGLNTPVEPTLYFAGYIANNSGIILIHTTGDPMAMAGALRREVAALDAQAPVSDFRTMEEVVDKSLAGRKFSVLLISLFGMLALALAAVGLYGVVSYSVTQRNREMGLRMALGAQQGQVLRMVIGEAMKLAIAGAAVGAVVAAFAGRALAGELYGVRASDPQSFAGAAATLLVVALLGAWIPARRAMTVDPAIALRDE